MRERGYYYELYTRQYESWPGTPEPAAAARQTPESRK
jgi:hypothetical protein